MPGAMNVIYKKKNFKIYDAPDGFIVHNTNLSFENHHTHLKNFNTCKFIIDLCIHKSIPNKEISEYLLVSILRISGDKIYRDKIQQLINLQKKNKNESKEQKQRYRNEKRTLTKHPKTF